jgi:hypothetical protein
MNTCGGVEIYLHAFMNLTLDKGEWSASRPCRFNPGKTSPNKNMKLGGSQGRFGHYEAENHLYLSGIELRYLYHTTSNLVTIPTERSQLRSSKCW